MTISEVGDMAGSLFRSVGGALGLVGVIEVGLYFLVRAERVAADE